MDRMKKILCVAVAVLMLAGVCSCSSAKYYNGTFTGVFDTFVQIYAEAESKKEFDDMNKDLAELLTEYHHLYDIYNDYPGMNNIKTINDNAGIAPVKVDRKIIDLLVFCKDAYYLTEGNVNVAMGSVLSLWHDARMSAQTTVYPQLPDEESLKEAALHTNIESIIIDEENGTVYISDPQTRLDVGAIAKGYATERAYEYLAGNGYDSGFISVGGNVKVLGAPEDGKNAGWNVGIQNPDAQYADNPMAVVSVDRGSLVTSGDYQRYFTVDGVQYHHIIDKDTLMPAEGVRSVSIWCEDSAVADVLSTYFFIAGYDEASEFIEENPEMNIDAYWISDDGSIKYTEKFAEHAGE